MREGIGVVVKGLGEGRAQQVHQENETRTVMEYV